MQTDLLLSRIDAFCSAHAMSASTFGRKSVNDGKLVHRLRSGKTITLQTLQRVDTFIAGGEAARARTRASARTSEVAA